MLMGLFLYHTLNFIETLRKLSGKISFFFPLKSSINRLTTVCFRTLEIVRLNLYSSALKYGLTHSLLRIM